MPSLVAKRDRRVLLVACGASSPSEEAFAGFLNVAQAESGRFKAVWVHSAGGHFDALQRRRASPYLKAAERIAIMSDSVIARGAITAFGWLVGGVRPFDTHAFQAARDYLDASLDQEELLRELIRSV